MRSKMKNQYRKYRMALLKSRAGFVANCREGDDPQRDSRTFIIATVCVCCGRAKENGWAFVWCQEGGGDVENHQMVAVSSKTSLTVMCILGSIEPYLPEQLCGQKRGSLGYILASADHMLVFDLSPPSCVLWIWCVSASETRWHPSVRKDGLPLASL